ncbi:hypothetical protein SAMN04488510_10665 [Fervidobacterium changbaicum]|jgi:hypothetical protein|nr:hypothetical protein SAMN04488510_10665 [Fervidobacterium changbaicum]
MDFGRLKAIIRNPFAFVKKKKSKLLKLMITHPLSFPKTMYYNLR